MASRAEPSRSSTSDSAGAAIRAGRSVACIGCGEQPEDLRPTDAIASLRLLERRTGLLLGHGQQVALSCDPGGGMPQAAVEPAARLAVMLSASDRRLRSLLGEHELPPPENGPPTLRIFASPSADPVVADRPPSLAESADGLVRAIAGATTEDWYRRRPREGISAAELVWLALHDAMHYLEDIDLAVARTTSQTPRRGPRSNC